MIFSNPSHYFFSSEEIIMKYFPFNKTLYYKDLKLKLIMFVCRLFGNQQAHKYLANNCRRAYTTERDKDKTIPIQSLSQLIRQKQKMQIPNLQKQNFEPSELYLAAIRALKRNYHHDPEQETKLVNCLNKYKDDYRYINNFVCLILPTDYYLVNFTKFYMEIAMKYLKKNDQFHFQDFYIILENMSRIINMQKSNWDDENWVMRDYIEEQQIMELFVLKYLAARREYDHNFMIKLISVCNSLQVNSAELGLLMLQKINDTSFRSKMIEIIDILKYLGKLNSFPYEYFYENKSVWISAIESYNKYSRKKSLETIKMFELIILINPMNCELMIKRLQDLILQAIPSLDNEELANLWYLSTRAKFGIYSHLTNQMLEKMMAYAPNMITKQLCLLVKGFARFKYLEQNKQICIATLSKIKGKLTKEREFEHQVIQYILNSYLKEKITSLQ